MTQKNDLCSATLFCGDLHDFKLGQFGINKQKDAKNKSKNVFECIKTLQSCQNEVKLTKYPTLEFANSIQHVCRHSN